MSSPVRLATFCRLCLSNIEDKVPVFNNGNTLETLMQLIEIQIDPDDEPEAVVCYDCVVTLEGFYQFKEQCHANDKFVRTISSRQECSASSPEVSEDEDASVMEVDVLEEEEDLLELDEGNEEKEENERKELSFEDNFLEYANKTNKRKDDLDDSTIQTIKSISPLTEYDSYEEVDVENKEENERKKSSFEEKFLEYATKTMNSTDDVDDSYEEVDVAIGSRPKRKISASYATGQNKLKHQPPKPESNPEEQEVEKISPKKIEDVSKPDEGKQKDGSNAEEEFDLDKIEQEYKALKIRHRAPLGPSLDEQLVLADSYPDYFYFEKLPRVVHYILVYYGERYYSAVFTEYYTYWHCRQRRKYDCPALVRVTNNYKVFERRYEHTHPDIKSKEGEAFTPMEALPNLFEACRKIVLKYRAKRRKKVLEKYKR